MSTTRSSRSIALAHRRPQRRGRAHLSDRLPRAARAAAEAADARAKAGLSLGPLDGALVTIKDLFDVAGEVTRAGSKVLADGRQAGGARRAHRAPPA